MKRASVKYTCSFFTEVTPVLPAQLPLLSLLQTWPKVSLQEKREFFLTFLFADFFLLDFPPLLDPPLLSPQLPDKHSVQTSSSSTLLHSWHSVRWCVLPPDHVILIFPT